MILHVTKARYRGGCKVWLAFNDGTSGQADLAGHLTGPVFEPLRDPKRFASLRVDEELGTVVWDNGADLAPEFLRGLVKPVETVTKKALPSVRRTATGRGPRGSRSLRTTRKSASS